MTKRAVTESYYYSKSHRVVTMLTSGPERLLRKDSMTLAQCSAGAPLKLFAVDKAKSQLAAHFEETTSPINYTVYGYADPTTAGATGAQFCGEPRDPHTRLYLLGNGHRCYSSTLMRFISSDSLGPFAEQGHNTYAYCSNDPVNFSDPDGKTRKPFTIKLDENWTLVRSPLYERKALRWGQVESKAFDRHTPPSAIAERRSSHFGLRDRDTRSSHTRNLHEKIALVPDVYKGLTDKAKLVVSAYIRVAYNRIDLINSNVKSMPSSSMMSREFVAISDEWRSQRSSLKALRKETTDPFELYVLTEVLRSGR